DPYVVYPSTVNLWTSFGKKQGFQTPRIPHAVDQKVIREFRTVYDRLEAAKPLIPPGNYVEVRYEDLVKDVTAGVETVYAGLSLPGFTDVRPKLEAFAAGNKGYETNKWALTREQRTHVREHWGDIVTRLGYKN
ncbi:MAG: sulfotransferase, partial [Fimbriiglobus sp.]